MKRIKIDFGRIIATQQTIDELDHLSTPYHSKKDNDAHFSYPPFQPIGCGCYLPTDTNSNKKIIEGSFYIAGFLTIIEEYDVGCGGGVYEKVAVLNGFQGIVFRLVCTKCYKSFCSNVFEHEWACSKNVYYWLDAWQWLVNNYQSSGIPFEEYPPERHPGKMVCDELVLIFPDIPPDVLKRFADLCNLYVVWKQLDKVDKEFCSNRIGDDDET
jgi:hypothetical protein